MAKVNLNLISDISGKVDNAVFVKTRQGTIVRSYAVPHDPHTPAQAVIRSGMAHAAVYYHALTPEELDAWRNYAAKQAKRDAQGNPTNTPSAYNLFTALTRSFLQLHPNGTPPTLPPAASFVGDIITLAATTAPKTVLFTATAPNNALIQTELLLQPLVNAGRLPMPREYRSKGFVRFEVGSLVASVSVYAGAYAPAFRFIHSETGQKSVLVPLPNIVVT